MAAPKGTRPPNAGKGRPRGVPNRINRDVRAAIGNAFETLGGENYLVTVGKENPAVFCRLLGQTIPKEISGPNGGPIPVQAVVNVTRANSTQFSSS